MGLRGDAAIVGIFEHESVRRFNGQRTMQLDQWAELSALALADAGLSSRDVNGLVCSSLAESAHFVPSTIAEYLGWGVGFGERVDLGGATAVASLWRAAAAIELGLCDVVVVSAPAHPIPRSPIEERITYGIGAMSDAWGSPQADYELPYGNVAQNVGYAMIAQRYADAYGWDERAVAKIAADQRTNALANPLAVFRDQPITVDDVLASKMIASPMHVLEIVMPTYGGASYVVASREIAERCRHRPAYLTGFGEHISSKVPHHAPDMLDTPMAVASPMAMRMAGITHADVDLFQPYDCYTITVLMTLEDAGFCARGEGAAFVRDHDLTFSGDFPCNTHGGQLGMGQARGAGGASHILEAVRQLRGKADARQLRRCDTAFVTGNGGLMSEQNVAILRGA